MRAVLNRIRAGGNTAAQAAELSAAHTLRRTRDRAEVARLSEDMARCDERHGARFEERHVR